MRWTLELVREQASRFDSRIAWKKGHEPSYAAAVRKGWLEEACLHMGSKATEKWTDSSILKESSKFSNVKEWRTKSPKSYDAACKKGIVRKISSKMAKDVRAWSDSEILEDAKKHTSKTVWARSSSAYVLAKIRGIFDIATAHMTQVCGTSRHEKDILSLVKENFPKAHTAFFNNKKTDEFPFSKIQLDIYVPEIRKGIEFDGTYWHSFEGLKRGKPKWKDEDLTRYHDIKDRFFQKSGIEVMHVKEAEWTSDRHGCIKKINDFLGITYERR